MDQTVSLTQRKILFETRNQDYFADIYVEDALSVEDRDHRGSLVVIINLHVIFPQEESHIDLPKLNEELYHSIREFYYHEGEIGSPLEALEQALHRAQEKNLLITNKSVQADLAAIAMWGKTMIYANPDNCFIGIRRNNELFELDQDPYGNEVLKDDDLILLATPSLKSYHVDKLLREKQELNNTDFSEELTHISADTFADKPEPAVGYAFHINIERIPGDEEVIEIHLPPSEEKKESKKLFPPLLANIKENKDAKQKKKRSEDPAIYLKPVKQKRGRRVLFLLILTILLIASIYFTYQYNQRKQEEASLQQNIQQGITQLERAKELARLNPKESEALLEETTAMLGQVKGSRTDITQQVSELEKQAIEIKRSIYKTNDIQPIETAPTEMAQKRVVRLEGQRVLNFQSEQLIIDDGKWNSPIQVDTYDQNVYVLDPGASALWKYVRYGNGYSAASNYFKESISLNNAIDVSIDGSVYILYPDRIERYTVGKRDDFKLSGIHPEINNESRLAVEPDGKYLFISTENRILVFGNDGRYEKLLVSDKLGTITDIVSTDKGSTIWALSNGTWLKITL